MPDQPENHWQLLCVDDEPGVLNSLRRALRNSPYELTLANSGEEALAFTREKTFDLIISDMRMPGMSGAEFLAGSLEYNPDCIRILLTGYADIESTVQAINEGKIHRYIQKPWNNDDLLLTLEQSLQGLQLKRENEKLSNQLSQKNKELEALNSGLEEKVQLRTQQIRQALTRLEKANTALNQTLLATVKAFYNIISLTPHLGGRTAMQTAELCKLLGMQLELPKNEIRNVYLAGLLHQLGMIGLDEALLLTPRNQLTDADKATFLKHPEHAALALAPSSVLSPVSQIIKAQYMTSEELSSAESLSSEVRTAASILATARDYVLATEGLLLETRCTSASAIDYLRTQTDLYQTKIADKLPLVADQVSGSEQLSSDEQKLRVSEVKPGMKLTRNLLNSNDILLLAEGHTFTPDSLVRLKTFDTEPSNPLELFVIAPVTQEEKKEVE